ncbi:predicted protein [Plenodomus lingam JN3]|uniref:Predicted protein n=1 Tax=Leptosphaeria maculans (strain JN3 / isolate v23.1.3 / race Av1-4-5-6-7-8) TaxID=985895 RepID=E4ZMI9_LEPMJ|nr:predicted protein [Plenodomus lingam JN3]CBX92858.1 predicted protein [Plenodomus lingam JN3]
MSNPPPAPTRPSTSTRKRVGPCAWLFVVQHRGFVMWAQACWNMAVVGVEWSGVGWAR